jgi:hypothetical protein
MGRCWKGSEARPGCPSGGAADAAAGARVLTSVSAVHKQEMIAVLLEPTALADSVARSRGLTLSC